MEPNLPVAAKKIWSIVRVLYFMLRKGISKKKVMVDLNMMMKRGKIAGKALHNLMFHHASATGRRAFNFPPPPPGEYEFSCSNSPAYPAVSLFFNKYRKNQAVNSNAHLFSCTQSPATEDDVATVNAVVRALEMIQHSDAASPALPGFGRSPMVRQLRITDSPFPLRGDVEDDSHVDEAAEEFIVKFYKDLKKQNLMAFD